MEEEQKWNLVFSLRRQFVWTHRTSRASHRVQGCRELKRGSEGRLKEGEMATGNVKEGDDKKVNRDGEIIRPRTKS